MKIGIDLDSTLNCLDEPWCRWINENHDPDFTLDKWTCWDIHKLSPAGLKVYDYLSIPGVFRTLAVRPGAIDNTRMLIDQGHELYVVSASIPEAWPDKCAWLKEHFPHINKKRLICTESKSVLRLDVLIDDGAHNLFEFGGSAIAYDRPWNREWQGLRATHWDQIPNMIERLEKCGR